MRIVAFSFLSSLVFLSEGGFAQAFKAPPEHPQWSTTASLMQCTLSQSIPGYGQAIFTQEAGGTTIFELKNILGNQSAAPVKLLTYPPHWKRENQPRLLLAFSSQGGEVPVILKKKTPYKLLESLNNGKKVAFIFESQNEIILSSAGFQKSYTDYLKCIQSLLPSFEQLKENTIYFESGSALLSKVGEAHLKELANFILTDGKIRRIDVTGHSDTKGRYVENKRLANERMWQVKDYLVMQQGISPDLFTLKGYGELKPIGKNKTAEGRQKNRRVEIKLYR